MTDTQSMIEALKQCVETGYLQYTPQQVNALLKNAASHIECLQNTIDDLVTMVKDKGYGN